MATTGLKRTALLLLTAFIGLPSALRAEEPAPGQPVFRDAHGDPLPAQAEQRLGTLRWRHGAAITHAAYMPDGRSILTNSEDGTLRLWDPATGTELRRFHKDAAPPDETLNQEIRLLLRGPGHGTAVSPDGRTLASGAADGSIMLWDTATARVLHRLHTDGKTPVAELLFSPDNEMLVSKDSDQTLRLWDVARGTELRRFYKSGPQVRGFAAGAFTGPPIFQAGGSVLASVVFEIRANQVRTAVRRWDIITGREIEPVELTSGANPLAAFAFAPDGKRMVVASYLNSLRLWDLEAGKELRQFDGPDTTSFVSQIAFSPDGKIVATWSSDRTLRLWDPAAGKELRRLTQPWGPRFMGIYFFSGALASNLAFSSDGKTLVMGTTGGSVWRWDVETGKELAPATGHRDGIHTLKVSLDGKTALSCGTDRTVHVWDMASGKELRQFALPGDVTQTAFSPDGRTIALANPEGTLFLWDVAEGKEIRQWRALTGGIASLAFSPDGKRLAARGFDRVIQIWDPATGKAVRQIGEMPNEPPMNNPDILRSFLGSSVPNLLFSADGAAVAAVPPADNDAVRNLRGRNNRAEPFMVRLWDVNTGKLLRAFDKHASGTMAFAYAPDARTLASAHADGSLCVWESDSGKLRLSLPPTAGHVFTALAFSPDSRVLAAADDTGTIHFRDALSGAAIGSLTGHQGKILTLTFTADGSRLLSGGADTSALVWNVAPLLRAPRTGTVRLEDGREEAMWDALAIADPARAHQAALRLLSAPGRTVPLLRERLRPVAAPEADKVARLLSELDSNELAVRRKAAAELEKLGELAEPAVREALGGQPSLEKQKRLEQLQDRLVTGTSLPPAQLQALRAVEILERIGTPEARDVLQALAGGASGARLTRQAQASLARLGKP